MKLNYCSRHATLVCVVAISALVGACGGGVDAPLTPTEGPTDATRSAALDAVNADRAAYFEEASVVSEDTFEPERGNLNDERPLLADSADDQDSMSHTALSERRQLKSSDGLIEPEAATSFGQLDPTTQDLSGAKPSVWHTRFDSGEFVDSTGSEQGARLRGVPARSNTNIVTSTQAYSIDPGRLAFQYTGGSAAQREALVTLEPGNPGNHILKFVLKYANVRDEAGVPYKGRVQMNAHEVQASELRFATRMYLHPDMAHLRTMPKAFGWLTISEWWNNASWVGQRYPFRISVNVAKPDAKAGSPLRFRVSAQTLDEPTNNWNKAKWELINPNVEVPIGQWVTLEYYYRQGNASNGRFYMAMVPDGGSRQLVFDVQNWTHHPDDPAPDGLTHLNPLKLYTSKANIDYVRNRGGALQIYWDDLSFRICAKRVAIQDSACRPPALQ